MPFYDLNVSSSQDETETRRTLSFLKELGYNVVALSHTLSGKLPNDLICPIPSSLLSNAPLHVLTRCTLVLSDNAQNHRLATLVSNYDILALRPTNTKTLEQACRDLDCDMISLDLTQRFDSHFRSKTLMQAVDRGIGIELCYSQGVMANDPIVRRTVIGNATAIIRATKGRGIVLSSEAKKAVGCRGPADVLNMAAVWGLGAERSRESLDAIPRRVIGCAALERESYRGVVKIVDGGRKPATEAQKAEGKAKQNTGKRKADVLDGSQTINEKTTETIAKAPSKRELKRRKKAEEQAKRDARMSGEVD